MLENEKKSSQDVSAQAPAEQVQEATLGNTSADFLTEIQQENARSAEDTEEKRKHEIPCLTMII